MGCGDNIVVLKPFSTRKDDAGSHINNCLFSSSLFCYVCHNCIVLTYLGGRVLQCFFFSNQEEGPNNCDNPGESLAFF